MTKRDSPEHKRKLAAYLHETAAESRKTAAQIDQMAARMERALRPEGEPIRCCEPGPCMVCGVDSPSGHAEVDLPGSRETRRLPIGRVCSSHTLWELAKADKFLVYIESEPG